MVRFSKKLMSASSDDASDNDYVEENDYIEENDSIEENNYNDNDCSNKYSNGCNLCLNPIFYQPDKVITCDFQIEVRDLCQNSRFALVAEVRRIINGGRYQTLATVHDIFDVPACTDQHKNCNCRKIIRVFRDVILDLYPTLTSHDDPYHKLDANDLYVTIVLGNYISRNDPSCHFYD